MATLKPVFSFAVGGFQATDARPVGGPSRMRVERDMAVPADAFEVDFMDRSGIEPTDPVTVKLGHDEDPQTVFTGQVVEIRPTLVGVRVRALGTMHALLNLRVAAFYEDQTAGEIVGDLVGQAGLTAGTIDDGPVLPRFTVDRRLSAYAHVRALADRLGFEFFTDREGQVMFRALGAAADLDAAGGGLLGAAVSAVASALGLGGGGEGYAFGKHLVAAAARHRAPGLTRVEVGGESPMSSQGDATAYWLTKSDNENHGEAGEGDPAALIRDPVARTKDLADRFAAGYRIARTRREHETRVTVLGRANLELGDAITVSGAPDGRVNGSGYVQAIRHRVGPEEGFLTDVRVVVKGES